MMTKNKLVGFIFFLALFFLFLLPPFDPDLGWQLRCGQLFWEKGSFCQQNQFSVLLADYHWPNHHWLYQATLWPLFKLSGLWGLSLANAFLMSLAFFFFYLAIKNFVWEKTVAMGLVILLGWGVFSLGLRSQLTAFFFFNLILWLLSQIERKPRLALLLPFIILVWANSHGSVLIGLALLGLLWLPKAIAQRKTFFLWLAIIFLFLLATLLNPSGLGIHQEAFRHLAGVKLETLIAEWLAPNQAIQWLILTSTLGLSAFILAEKKLTKIFPVLALFGFAFLAFKARRNVPFYFLLGVYLFFTSSLTPKLFSPWQKKKILGDNLAVITPILGLFLGLLICLPLTANALASWENYCQQSSLAYPYQAVAFLKNQPEKGNLFNRYEWGGFLIWQLPEYQVFVDGRMPAWPTPSGKSPYTIYLETLQTQPGWQKTLERHGLNWILISPGTFMDLKLSQGQKFEWDDPKAEEEYPWQEIYRDQVSVVYQKQ